MVEADGAGSGPELKLVCSTPFGCPNKNVRHETDDLKELHGSIDKPLPLGDSSPKGYIRWMYAEIDRRVMLAKRCYKDLFGDIGGTKAGDGMVSTRRIDRIVVRDVKGNHHVFYFDVSAPMEEDGKKLEAAYKDMQAGKEIDPETKRLFEEVQDMQRTGRRSVRFPLDKKR